MRFGRTSKAVGVAAVAALALSACAESGGGEDSGNGGGGEASGGTVTVAEVNPFSSFNSDTAVGNVDINNKVALLTTNDFNYINSDLEVVPREEFGTYEVVSEDPLTVTYTVNEGVTWSDGEPVDADDLLLSWAATSAYFDDESDPDPEVEGDETGTTYFSAASTSGLDLTEMPELGEDGRSITLVYSEPYADWEIAFGVTDTPAHVVATNAGLADGDALIEAIQNAPEGDPENPQERPEISAIADFWNTGFDSTSLPSDPSLYLSNGPYVVSEMVPDQSMTLIRNEDYNWGPVPAIDEITIRYIGDANAQVQALQNGEVDIIQPQASADTLTSLEAIDGVEILQGPELSFDHLDLYQEGGVFADENVRKAFMMTVPLEQIVDATIRPLDPESGPRMSQIFDFGTEPYLAAIEENGSAEYAEPDIEGAKELLDGATPEVRIMYNAENPNRVDAYTLIAESAEQAGFRVVDVGLPGAEWGPALEEGGARWDATIFGWISPGVGVTGVPQLYGCGSASNYVQWCDEEAQEAMDELILTTDPAEQQELQTVVDTRLYETGFGLPLFQSVGINGVSDRIEGTEYMSNQDGIWWNYWEWTVAE